MDALDSLLEGALESVNGLCSPLLSRLRSESKLDRADNASLSGDIVEELSSLNRLDRGLLGGIRSSVES